MARINYKLLLDSQLSGLYGYADKGSPQTARKYILKIADEPIDVDWNKLHHLLAQDIIALDYRHLCEKLGTHSKQLYRLFGQAIQNDGYTPELIKQISNESIRLLQLKKGGGPD